MRYFFYYAFSAVLAFLLGIIMVGCVYNTQRERHFYLEHGQRGYVHVPSTKKNRWMTYEIIAPKQEEVK